MHTKTASRFVLGAAALFASSVASTASAADDGPLGDKGQFIISAERVSPLLAHSRDSVTTTAPNGVESTSADSRTTVALLWNGSATTIHNVPRFAFDYTVIDKLTIGGSIMAFFTPGSSRTVTSGSSSATADQSTTTIFGIAPRVGYILKLADIISFWPRGGFSFTSLNISDTDVNGNITTKSSTTRTLFALNIEPMFVITPVHHFGITLGPVVDIPLTGSQNTERTTGSATVSTKQDHANFHVGLTAGILGYL